MGRPVHVDGKSFYEPTLRKKNNRYYIRFYHPDKRPKRKEIPLRTSEKDAAEILFHQLRFEALNGLYDPWAEKRSGSVTLDEAVDLFLASQEVRASSLKSKRVRLKPFARKHPGMLVSGVTVQMIREYCHRNDLKTSTRNRYLAEIRLFLDFCREQGWIMSNPARDLQKLTPRRKRKVKREITEYLTPDELRRVIDAVESDIETNPRHRGRGVLVHVLRLAVMTGMRRGEICNLRWRDVRLYDPPRQTRSGRTQYGWISVRNTDDAETKTGHEDRIPIVAPAHRLLLRLHKNRGASGYVFESPRKRSRLSAWWVSNRFRFYRRKAGIREEIHFHSLRHTCASWLVESGVDIKVVQEVLRHSTIKQTMRYAHLGPEAMATKMVEAFDAIDVE